ncbi:hypothetical protein FAES_0510 [Fibrella aestuarina BUZ 2]|uniref:Uncharacterized protein n=1 Tax=Fibrella aestuarina BUZ 2 TaxID=1166018 RepID=I0K318_9BACT|nr:hypothetical protein [Fibrella aestuarina]CCG98521.1 hypothetical protein FAES_0510 [Fibrella aestuarina BUZ 2]
MPYRVNIDVFWGMALVDRYGVKAYPTRPIVDAADGIISCKLTGIYLLTYLQVELEHALSIAAAQTTGKKRRRANEFSDSRVGDRLRVVTL